MLVLALLVAVATATTPAPTVPTPYPTITPAPESGCAYDDDDQGPFALDCLQEAFLAAGCSMRGESYPTVTTDDASDDTGAGGDNLDRDKFWYNNNDNSWADVKEAMRVMAEETTSFDCFGPTTDTPTENPTPSPTSASPSPSPTRTPTTLTPAPIYAEDAVWALISMDGGVAADLVATCERMGYRRQYDATHYVISVSENSSDRVDYRTVADGEEICDLFDGTSDSLVGTRHEGPFQALSGTRADGQAFLDFTSAGMTIKVTSKRNYSQCREIETGFGDDFAADLSASLCEVGLGAGNAGKYSSTTACTASDTNSRLINMFISNQLFDNCSSDCLYDLDGNAAFKWADTCWDDDSSATDSCPASDYAEAMAGMLCTERCDYTTQRYLADSDACYSVTAVGTGVDSCTGSINSAEENALATTLCANSGADDCYVNNVAADWHTKSAVWSDGVGVDFVNFVDIYENAGWDETSSTTQLTLDASNGKWSYNNNGADLPTICRDDANADNDETGRTAALNCIDGDDFEAMSASSSYPRLFAPRSGFTNGAEPGELHVVLQIPRTLYGFNAKFENSTNDIAEYQQDFGNAMWRLNQYDTGCRSDADIAVTCGGTEGACDADCSWHDAAGCGAEYELELSVPWTVFNLGGAGGVQRLQSYESTDDAQVDPDTDTNNDGSNHKYIFGSTIRVAAKQPIHVDVDEGTEASVATNQFRKEEWVRNIVARIPTIIKFQKTVHVDTNLDVISTKFNYKTVAAVIQSIQYDTQFFTPPYAKFKVQIRTKSQYPYRMNDNVDTATLNVANLVSSDDTNVGLVLEHLADDRNCTFTNPDHMREGDICIQEWMLYITPQANVCFATGEYTITYEAACYHGKEVCYMPTDDAGTEITTVSFTFKLQSSKFCPSVVDEVDLLGTLAVTGRRSFKPTEDSLEGPTEQDLYLQGEEVYFFGTTSSDRAIIKSTEVVMVQIRQDLSGLVQTGYQSVHYDPTSEDMVVWTKDNGDGNRVATGTVRINTQDGATDVQLVEDANVFPSGSSFLSTDGLISTLHGDSDSADYTFSEMEAGFIMLLHARALPVNIDSHGLKTVAATFAVEYDSLGSRRRRLLTTTQDDTRAVSRFGLQAWTPGKLPLGLSDTASMGLTMSLYNSEISRRNAPKFAQAIKSAMLNGMNADPARQGKVIYDEQISVDIVYSNSVPIWKRPQHQAVGGADRRRMSTSSQTLRVEFTFARGYQANSMDLHRMMEIFKKQVVMPSSPLMTQEVFFGAVIHELVEIDTSNYEVPSGDRPSGNVDILDLAEESGYTAVAPCLALLAALLALIQ